MEQVSASTHTCPPPTYSVKDVSMYCVMYVERHSRYTSCDTLNSEACTESWICVEDTTYSTWPRIYISNVPRIYVFDIQDTSYLMVCGWSVWSCGVRSRFVFREIFSSWLFFFVICPRFLSYFWTRWFFACVLLYLDVLLFLFPFHVFWIFCLDSGASFYFFFLRFPIWYNFLVLFVFSASAGI